MIFNLNVLLDMAVDDAKLTGRPLREVIDKIVTENSIELLPFQKEQLDKVCGAVKLSSTGGSCVTSDWRKCEYCDNMVQVDSVDRKIWYPHPDAQGRTFGVACVECQKQIDKDSDHYESEGYYC